MKEQTTTKLRNKKTGAIYDEWYIYINGVKITSVKQFNDTFEDYKPKEPYIGDETTAKFVRAWAKHWGFEVVTAHICTGSVELVGWTEPSTRGREIDILGGFVSGALEEGKDYTIDELCGEEE